jgi:hypothetical protein
LAGVSACTLTPIPCNKVADVNFVIDGQVDNAQQRRGAATR